MAAATLWPFTPGGAGLSRSVFSFYDGALYRMLVTYDSAATKGLTDDDMIRVVSAKYGTATRPVARRQFPHEPVVSGATEKVIARWEDSQYSLNLFRSSAIPLRSLCLQNKWIRKRGPPSPNP